MIIIDPGHGGSDPGGGSNDYWKEKDLNLKISQYIYNRLKKLNIPVEITRNTDETLNPTNRIKRINELIRNNKDVLIVSNHINKDLGILDGADIYHSIYDSPKFSNIVKKNLISAGQNVRGVYTRINDKNQDYYYIIRNNRPNEAVIIEYGFADSPGDDINQLLYNWDGLAESVVKSIAEYKGYNYALPSQDVYTVKSGDSLYKIALNYDTTVDILKELNNLDGNTIYPGQILKIPSKEKEVVNTVRYKVKYGDSLYTLSKRFNTTIDTLKELNDLTDNNIYVNQYLLIPTIDLTEYTVKSGDSLYKIAMNYGTTVDLLMLYNGLETTIIRTGQQLLVPK